MFVKLWEDHTKKTFSFPVLCENLNIPKNGCQAVGPAAFLDFPDVYLGFFGGFYLFFHSFFDGFCRCDVVWGGVVHYGQNSFSAVCANVGVILESETFSVKGAGRRQKCVNYLVLQSS